MPPLYLLAPNEIPREVVADLAEIRRHNPQRFEMEQLTAITLLDPAKNLVAGYKDVREDEFWVKGHLPGFPLYPGVLMCEAAAQLCAYFCSASGLLVGDAFVGFGGMDDVRFRGMVRPGQRLWLVGQTEKTNQSRFRFKIQGFVENQMVFNADFLGLRMERSGTSASGGT